MKIVVSYINSIYDIRKTIKKIDLSIADGIHVDLMDGMYVANNNLNVSLLPELFKGISKPLDIHLMVLKPSKYLDILYKLIPDCIYIHPETEQDPIAVIKNIKEHCHVGIVINPNQNIEGFKDYLKYINRVLLMSVIPGKGGQKFIENTKYDAQNRVESTIRIATTTVEGDLILYDLSYDGENYTLKSDYTRDNYMAEENRKVVINDDIPGEFYTVNLIGTDGAVELMLLLVAQLSQEYNIINENNDVYITTLDGKKYEDINIISYPSDATVYPVAPEFRAEVLEVFDNVMWIKPIENGEGLGDKLLINTQGNDFEVGDTVRVIFTGLIRDTYPAQIEVISVEKFEIYNN